jgi:hypothetical protein
MLRVSVFIRCLMVFLCLVPFASARQMGAALAPCLPLTPLAASNESPPPASEEDDEREGAEGKERLAAPSRHRLPDQWRLGLAPLARDFCSPATSRPHPSSPFDTDPFRNGLGSPYRC